MYVKLLKHVFPVSVDCITAEVKLIRNLIAGKALTQKFEYFFFPPCECGNILT